MRDRNGSTQGGGTRGARGRNDRPAGGRPSGQGHGGKPYGRHRDDKPAGQSGSEKPFSHGHGRGGKPAGQHHGAKSFSTRPVDIRRQQKTKPEPPAFAFRLFPLDGVEGRGVRIGLGDTREQVVAACGADRFAGEPVEGDEGRSLSFYQGELVVSFAPDDTVELIEFVGSYHGRLHPMLGGMDLARVDADWVMRKLSEKIGSLDSSGEPYEYVFLRAEICLYRESSPDDFEDMKDEGAFADERERAEEELMATRWATVGIGRKGFFDE